MEYANVGSLDRIVRFVLGAALLASPFAGIFASASSTAGTIIIIVGLILMATATISFCPLYRLIGARTNAK